MNILWLQASGCGGCTMSLLCAEAPGLFDMLDGAGLRFLWHPALSVETGAEVQAILRRIETGEVCPSAKSSIGATSFSSPGAMTTMLGKIRMYAIS